MRTGNLNWRVNNEINAESLRVIGADNKLVGIMSSTQAIKVAKDAGKDLIEIAPLAKPPVAKIIEIGKFKYEQEKKEREEKRKVKGGELKEVRFSPFIAENDFQTRLARVREFLGEGNKARIVVKFTGRQMTQKAFGYEVIAKVARELGETAHQDMEAKFLGRHLVTIFSPIKLKKS